MGFLVNLCGRFRCVKCGMESEAGIQTKLFRSEAENSNREYRVGESELVDGIDNYFPLFPWNGSEPLVVAIGDWSCGSCGLGWQWAQLVLALDGIKSPDHDFRATVLQLSTLVPLQASDLDGIHFVESWLAELSGIWGRGSDYDWAGGRHQWLSLPVGERCELVASGYRAWYREFGIAESHPC